GALRAAGFPFGTRPESRGVGGQYFVTEGENVTVPTEFDLGVGDDDAAHSGVRGTAGVDPQSQGAQLLRDLAALLVHHIREGDGFVVALGGLSTRGEDRFRQYVAIAQTARQCDAGNRPGALVFLQARPGQITARDAFDLHHLQRLDPDAAT